MKITFNSPYITGKETEYILDAVQSGHISGNGKYTKTCQRFFEQRYGIKKALMTTSCTDGLEMCAMLLDIKSGDEVIVPSYTFVSSALAFVREGAKIIFADSKPTHPNLDVTELESLISEKTKAIVVVHYGGVACQMNEIMALAEKYGIYVVEDAAQAIDATYFERPLGTIGDLATFSFHETKNVQCGEGGMLAINNEKFVERAEVLWEKGTDRTKFFRGEIDKYGWVDTGSSFLPSELNAAFLYAQLEQIDDIQEQRVRLWNQYYEALEPLERASKFQLMEMPEFASQNAHMFYLICASQTERNALLTSFKDAGIRATFHYQCLHKSTYYLDTLQTGESERSLPHAEMFSSCLIRLPLYYTLTYNDQKEVIEVIKSFYQ